MAINRFYNPSRGQYISQFIPNELPAELMLGIIGKKEKEQKDEVSKLQALQDQLLKVGAIKNSLDEEVRDDYKNKLTSFIDQSSNIDFSNPNLFREYSQLLRHFNPSYNQELSKIHSQYEHDKEMTELEDKFREKGEIPYSLGVYFEAYKRSLEDYRKEKGFKGDIQLVGKDDIKEAVDKKDNFKKYFDDIKASGSEKANSFMEGLSKYVYENSWEGVGSSKIRETVEDNLKNILNSTTGDQIKTEVWNKYGLYRQKYNKLSDVEKKKIDEEVYKETANQFLTAGEEFIWGKQSSNKAEVLNKAQEEARTNAKKSRESLTVFSMLSNTVNKTAQDLQYDLKQTNLDIKTIENKLKDLKTAQNKGKDISAQELKDVEIQLSKLYTLKNIQQMSLDESYNNIKKDILPLYAKDIQKAESDIKQYQSKMTPRAIKLLQDAKGDVDKAYNHSKDLAGTYGITNTDVYNLKKLKDLKDFKKSIEHKILSDVNDRWKRDYKRKNLNQDLEINQEVISLNGLGKVEEELSKAISSNPNAYSFYDASGNPIQPLINAENVTELKGMGITVKNYQSKEGSEKQHAYVASLPVTNLQLNKEGFLIFKEEGKGSNVSSFKTIEQAKRKGWSEKDFKNVVQNKSVVIVPRAGMHAVTIEEIGKRIYNKGLIENNEDIKRAGKEILLTKLSNRIEEFKTNTKSIAGSKFSNTNSSPIEVFEITRDNKPFYVKVKRFDYSENIDPNNNKPISGLSGSNYSEYFKVQILDENNTVLKESSVNSPNLFNFIATLHGYK